MTRDEAKAKLAKFLSLPQCIELTNYPRGVHDGLCAMAVLVNGLNGQVLVMAQEEKGSECRLALVTPPMGYESFQYGGVTRAATPLSEQQIDRLLAVWHQQAIGTGFQVAG